MNAITLTLDEIVALADEAYHKLETAVTDIDRRRRALQEKQVSGGLTSGEAAELGRLDAGSAELSDAIDALMTVTLEKINDSQEIQQLRASIKAIDTTLKASIDKVNQTVKFVQDAAAVVTAVAQVAQALAAL